MMDLLYCRLLSFAVELDSLLIDNCGPITDKVLFFSSMRTVCVAEILITFPQSIGP